MHIHIPAVGRRGCNASHAVLSMTVILRFCLMWENMRRCFFLAGSWSISGVMRWEICDLRGSPFFPRASERRVLPIVGVCLSSSHLLIFTSSHFTSSHLHIFSLHIFSSSHLLIFTSSHLHIFSSSHLLIFTSAHLHICSSSHLLIFTSAHLHICSSSHLLILTSSHLHIFTSSHLHIFSSCPLGLLPSCPLLHIFSSSHLHIFITSSHLQIFSSCPLAPLALSFFSISLLKAGAGAVPTRRHETQPFRTKSGSIAKN